jgi:hypothetical protein
LRYCSQSNVPQFPHVSGAIPLKAVLKHSKTIQEPFKGLDAIDVAIGGKADIVLFEDPEGIRLEVNFVPGKGHFEHPEELPLKTMPGYENYPA